MKYLDILKGENASQEAKEVFAAIKKEGGRILNIYAAMANSPTALKAFLKYEKTLKSGVYSPKEAETIALAIAEFNQCEYCLCAHTAIGKISGLTKEEIIEIRKGTIADKKLSALANLAREIVSKNGYPSDQTVQKFFEAGYSKTALVELVALVSLNILTNYFNHLVQTDIDFPKVEKI